MCPANNNLLRYRSAAHYELRPSCAKMQDPRMPRVHYVYEPDMRNPAKNKLLSLLAKVRTTQKSSERDRERDVDFSRRYNCDLTVRSHTKHINQDGTPSELAVHLALSSHAIRAPLHLDGHAA